MPELVGLIDERRRVLRMEGRDVRDVLQNTVTVDITRLAPDRPLWGALLTPQGKYLADFFLIDAGGGAVLIDAAADEADDLARRLAMYSLRRDSRVAGEAGLGVALVWGGDGPPAAEGAVVIADPRSPALGWRLYAPDPAAALAASGARPAARADYDALRVAHLVPESGVELVPGESYILEMNFADLGGVDFAKGCYVGQEVTARMHHKTELRKRLVRVRVAGEAAPGTPIVTAEGRAAGTLFTQAGGEALAHLRLDRAKGELRAGEARVVYEG